MTTRLLPAPEPVPYELLVKGTIAVNFLRIRGETLYCELFSLIKIEAEREKNAAQQLGTIKTVIAVKNEFDAIIKPQLPVKMAEWHLAYTEAMKNYDKEFEVWLKHYGEWQEKVK